MSNLIEVDVLEDRNPDELSVTEKGKRSASREKEVVETDFVEFRDGTLAEVVEDPTDPNCTSLAIWRHGKIQYFKKFEHEGRIFVPLQRNDEELRQIRLPNSASPYGSLEALMRGLQRLIARCVHIDDYCFTILAYFVLATWFIDRLSIAPYLAISGLPQSGKTTLLQVLNLVCRRALLISDITPKSFYRLCALTPTFLIDEAGTIANERQLRHMLRAGTTRDLVALRAGRKFDGFGAKVICWSELPDDLALTSRCILIPMSEANQTNLSKPDDPEVKRLAMALRSQLLQYRLENYRKVKPLPIIGDEIFRPRTRDLLRTLCAASLQDPQQSESLVRTFRYCNVVSSQSLGTIKNAVLLTIFRYTHDPKSSRSILVGDLAKKVNDCLELSGARLRLKPRKVGAVLTSLGFTNRTPCSSGNRVDFENEDEVRIHDLANAYGIDRTSEQVLREPRALDPYGRPRDRCPLCDVKKEYWGRA